MSPYKYSGTSLIRTPTKCVPIREGSSFQGANTTYLLEVGTSSSILIREVSLIQGCPLRGVPLYMQVYVHVYTRMSVFVLVRLNRVRIYP